MLVLKHLELCFVIILIILLPLIHIIKYFTYLNFIFKILIQAPIFINKKICNYYLEFLIKVR